MGKAEVLKLKLSRERGKRSKVRATLVQKTVNAIRI
jgi:hypothetical protein